MSNKSKETKMSDIKFELTSESIVNAWGVTLFRIKATVNITNRGVKKGELGGFVESTHLSNGNARVSGNAWVYGDAQVYGNAWVSGDARVYGDAQVSGDARVFGDARVSGNAWVSGDARVYGDAQVSGDARVFGDARVSLKKAYIKGNFLSSSDGMITPVIIDQTKEDGFNSSRDYKNLLVTGDYKIEDIDPPEEAEKPASINIGGKEYEVTEELTKALADLKEL